MGTFTYDQPFNLGSTNGSISIDVRDSSNALLTNFTSNAQGIGTVTLTVSDTTRTTIYFVRNSDSVKLAVAVFDPRDWTDTPGITTLLGFITAAPPNAAAVATAVWANGSRTLSSFNTLVADTATAVAAAILVTPANKIVTSVSGWVTVNVLSTAAIQSIWDQALSGLVAVGSMGAKLKNLALGSDNRVLVSGDAHSSGETVAAVAGNVGGNLVGSVGSVTSGVVLSGAQQTALVNALQAAIIDEGDGQAVIQAFVDKIAAANPDLAGLTAGVIAAAVRDLLATQLARIDVPISNAVTAGNSAKASADSATTAGNAAQASAAAALAAVQNLVIPNPDFSPVLTAVNLRPTLAQMNEGLVFPPLSQESVSELITALRGGGNWIFNPFIHDLNGVGIAGAAVTIRRGATRISDGVTDATGRVLFGNLHGFALVNATDYSALVIGNGFKPLPPQAFQINGADAAPSFEMERFSLPPSDVVGEVTVRFDGLPYGVPGAGAKVIYEPQIPINTFAGENLVYGRVKDVTTEDDASAEITLPPSSALSGAQYRVRCLDDSKTYLDALITVPDTGGTVYQLIQAALAEAE